MSKRNNKQLVVNLDSKDVNTYLETKETVIVQVNKQDINTNIMSKKCWVKLLNNPTLPSTSGFTAEPDVLEITSAIMRLPKEIMIMIFKLLSPSDLKSVVLVCKSWKEIGEKPSLWTWFKIAVRDVDDLEKLSKGRMERIYHINVRILRARIRTISPQLLARVLCRVKSVNLMYTDLSREQLQVLCTRIIEGSVLNKLNMLYMKLNMIQPNLLALAVNQLTKVSIGAITRMEFVTPQQVHAILVSIAPGSSLKSLKIVGVDLSSLDPELLARSVRRLEELKIFVCDMTPHQVYDVFDAVMEGASLKTLDMPGIDLGFLDPVIFGEAVNKLEKITYYEDNNEAGNDMWEKRQIKEMFTVMSQRTQLRSLSMQMTNNMGFVDLSSIDSVVLAKALNNLERVILDGPTLSEHQLNAVLRLCGREETNLKKFKIETRDIAITDLNRKNVRRAKRKLGEGLQIHCPFACENCESGDNAINCQVIDSEAGEDEDD